MTSLINQGDFAAAAELIAPDFAGHFPGFPTAYGPAGLQQILSVYRTAFPDQHVTVDEVIAEGDMVACRVTFSGTHTGPLMGMPPTGKQFKVPGLQILRMAAGKAAEQWANSDDLGDAAAAWSRASAGPGHALIPGKWNPECGSDVKGTVAYGIL